VIEVLALVAAGHYIRDVAVLDRCRVQGRLEQEGDVGLAHHLVIEQQIPEFEGTLRIVHGVGQAELFDQAALAPAGTSGVLVGAHDVHLHFARRVAAQTRTVLHQDHARAVPGRSNGGADARESPAGDQDVGLQVDQVHLGFIA
jgi:hypothetical protein